MKSLKTDVKSFYEEYHYSGDWIEGDKRHIIHPWFNEVFCYNEFKNKDSSFTIYKMMGRVPRKISSGF